MLPAFPEVVGSPAIVPLPGVVTGGFEFVADSFQISLRPAMNATKHNTTPVTAAYSRAGRFTFECVTVTVWKK